MNERPRITFMIATRNRVGELVKTLESCLAQRGPAREILVVDDCSTDATYETVRERFPDVDIVRNAVNKGSIASRNDILRRARGDYIVALDDDSRFVDVDACERIVRRMDAEPDLGIIACQVIGPENAGTLVGWERVGEGGWRRTEQGDLRSAAVVGSGDPTTTRGTERNEFRSTLAEWHCSSFVACGAVIRGGMLKETGLLCELFYHTYDEPDLAIRAWDAGYRMVQWNEIVVYHEFSGLNRNEQRNHRQQARNEACSVVMRYPWWLVVPGVVGKLAGQARYAWRRGWGWAWREPRVWGEFGWRLPRALAERKAVKAETVGLVCALNRGRVETVEEVRELREGVGWGRAVFGGRSASRARWVEAAPRQTHRNAPGRCESSL